MITISFEDELLHDTCIDLSRAEASYGSLNAAALVTFISDVRAFENVQELIDYPGPVSYTHLDVYKRQVRRGALGASPLSTARGMSRSFSIPGVVRSIT